jgi:hypothetical protein
MERKNITIEDLLINPFIYNFSDNLSGRIRRQTNTRSESLLTVEWEGIQSGDHPDSAIRGFIVEYRAEKENQWNVHSGIIPYKGPNHQYRVQVTNKPFFFYFFAICFTFR